MATQPCAPAQGRSSSSEPERRRTSDAYGREGVGGLFKVTNGKSLWSVSKFTPPPPPLTTTSITLAFSLQQGSKQKGAVAEGLRLLCQLIKYLAGQWETQPSSGCRRPERSSALSLPPCLPPCPAARRPESSLLLSSSLLSSSPLLSPPLSK